MMMLDIAFVLYMISKWKMGNLLAWMCPNLVKKSHFEGFQNKIGKIGVFLNIWPVVYI